MAFAFLEYSDFKFSCTICSKPQNFTPNRNPSVSHLALLTPRQSCLRFTLDAVTLITVCFLSGVVVFVLAWVAAVKRCLLLMAVAIVFCRWWRSRVEGFVGRAYVILVVNFSVTDTTSISSSSVTK